MSVLEYIKKKYQKAKTENANNCVHKQDECKCLCHRSNGAMMHMFACCGQAKCNICEQEYNKKSNITAK